VATASKTSAFDLELAEEVARYYHDPLGYVFFAWDWNRGELTGWHGPNSFQERYLNALGKHVKERGFNGVEPVDPILMSRASGHGIGKSALCGMILNWLMSTRPFCRGVVTANTAPQLNTKTWAEAIKWARRSITGHWFEYTSGIGNMAMWKTGFKDSWRVDGMTCREENSESFAGLHAANSTPFYIFDEASAIPEAIFEVAQGGLTDGEPLILAFGNPTRSNGWFYNTHHGWSHRWDTERIDSRSVEGTNKRLFEQWIEQYGIDSDFVKVRVLGAFPSQAEWQFIPTSVVDTAQWRELERPEAWQPIIVGVDVARSGDAETVFYTRQGRDARTFDLKAYRERDLMVTAQHLAEHIQTFKPSAVFIDGGGVGGGLVDRMRELGFRECIEVNFGGKSMSDRYANKRAEMWAEMRDFLRTGCIPEHNRLKTDLISPEYTFSRQNNRLTLESKEDMTRRGIESPDYADALALTFAHPVGPRDGTVARPEHWSEPPTFGDYDPLSEV
jgi:hypothetical protein